MATATKTARSLDLRCPFCQCEVFAITLDLADLNVCRCQDCEEEFSPAEAAAKLTAMAERWAAVVRWIDTAPTV